MDRERTDLLVNRLLNDELNDAETEELLLLVAEDDNVLDKVSMILHRSNESTLSSEEKSHWDRVLSNIVAVDKISFVSENQKTAKLFPWNWAVAATITAIISISVWIFLANRQQVTAVQEIVVHHEDIKPGGNKAVLTLQNGEKIVLDHQNDGTLVKESSYSVSKVGSGALQIKSGQLVAGNNTSSLSLNIPVGGTYQLVLPDGSKVWLNASSGINFPATFAADKREVTIYGEAYFEIAKQFLPGTTQKRKPFIVKSKGQSIEVLGTHFNISAYQEDQDIQTTLVEGKVKVIPDARIKTKQNASFYLRPGEQSSLLKSNLSYRVHTVDVEEVIAWRNNLFQFNGASIESVMTEISRWYDVKIDYQNGNAQHLTGYISRDVPLSRVLKMLEEISDLKFTVKNRQVTINDKH